MAPANDKVVSSLLDLLRKSNWYEDGYVLQFEDIENFSPESRRTRFELRGDMRTDKATAVNAWVPDKVGEKCDDLADEFNLEIINSCDFSLEVSPKLKVASLLECDDHTKRQFLLQPNVKNLILCWTSFHEDTEVNLKAFSELRSATSQSDSNIRLVGLVLDDAVKPAKQLVRKLNVQFENLWVGEEGWESKACKQLHLEESAPTAYLFDERGKYVGSGELEDVTMMLLDESADTDYTSDDEGREVETANSSSTMQESFLKFIETSTKKLNSSRNADLCVVVRTISKFRCNAVKQEQHRGTKSEGKKFLPLHVTQRIIVSGEVYPEARESFEQFKTDMTAISRSHASGSGNVTMTGISFVTRPQPLTIFSPTCSNCRKQCVDSVEKQFYGCLVCTSSPPSTFCKDCRLQHDANHPLAILGLAQHDLKTTLFGLGHVKIDLKEIELESGDEVHPDVGCDACLRTVENISEARKSKAPQLRYKNLAKQDHDLCSKCYQGTLEDGSKLTEQQFFTKYQCTPTDPFCEMRSSIGVAFTRVAETVTIVDDDQVASLAPTTTTTTSHVPSGHTLFSWHSSVDARPAGHTVFSWGGN